MVDIDVLDRLEDGITPVEQVAGALGIPEDEARERLDALVRSGHVAGPILVRSGGPWREMGYGLLSRGKDAVENE